MELQPSLHALRVKLQHLLKNYSGVQKLSHQLKAENIQLKEALDEKENEIIRLQEKIDAMSVGSFTQNAEDKKDLEKRINGYLKEIEKCLALLKT